MVGFWMIWKSTNLIKLFGFLKFIPFCALWDIDNVIWVSHTLSSLFFPFTNDKCQDNFWFLTIETFSLMEELYGWFWLLLNELILKDRYKFLERSLSQSW